MGDMLDILSDNTGKLVSRMMEMSNKRQKVLAQNLANANTPDYARRTVKFEKELSDVLKRDTSKSEIDSLDIVVKKDEGNNSRRSHR